MIGEIPENKTIMYQKHMAHHNLENCDLAWIEKLRNCILIRHPRDVLTSYSKKYKINSIWQLGYLQQLEIFNVLNNNGQEAIIIDALDLLNNPKKILQKLCNKLNILFTKDMLSWPKGQRTSDGIWSKYWYKEVKDSTGFNAPILISKIIPKDYVDIYNTCLKCYDKLYSHRLF